MSFKLSCGYGYFCSRPDFYLSWSAGWSPSYLSGPLQIYPSPSYGVNLRLRLRSTSSEYSAIKESANFSKQRLSTRVVTSAKQLRLRPTRICAVLQSTPPCSSYKLTFASIRDDQKKVKNDEHQNLSHLPGFCQS